MPVHDNAAHAARLDQLARSLEQLLALRDQLEALTGTSGYGAWSPERLRSALPAGHEALLRLLAGEEGDGSAERIRDRLRDRFALEIDPVDESIGPAARLHNRRVLALAGSESAAAAAYEAASLDLEAIAALAAAADGAEDAKASLDLQNRILAQNAKSLLEAARMLAAAEVGEAQRRRLEAERALRIREMALPRFVNPRLDRP